MYVMPLKSNYKLAYLLHRRQDQEAKPSNGVLPRLCPLLSVGNNPAPDLERLQVCTAIHDY
jgi:hypothetical protein